ncbi:MAG: FAD-dependent oxidoreductase [Gammaproteobacteria bacterium]|nr:FAD-dependent oxidoreductase [Gammaproteobacteria bacterium]
MRQDGKHKRYPGDDHDRRWRELVFPENYSNPEPRRNYHLVVIGAGPAGLVASIAAAGLGARVALVERKAMGGDCLNVGCVPSKSLLEFTRRNPNAGFDEAFAWLRQVRSEIAAHDSVERYVRSGVDVFLGPARFAGRNSLEVDGQRLAARRFLIATGARAELPRIPGLEDCDALTSDSFFGLAEPPGRLAVLGAGPVGCELAQAMARLGVEVHLFEMAGHVLPGAIASASDAVATALKSDGVSLHLDSKVARISSQGGRPTVHSPGASVTSDRLLVAAGRRANVEGLNLAAAGVALREGRIAVDDKLRTTNRRIYAAGDVCSGLPFTHNADAQARIVVRNALFAPTASTRGLIVPQCTYTDPEVAQVGRTQAQLAEEGVGFDCYRVKFGELDRARTAGERDGFVELLTAGGSDRILGATIVGHDAGEQIAPLCMAMANGLGLGAVGKAVLPYPTRAEYLRRLADQYARTRLTPRAARLLKSWFR